MFWHICKYNFKTTVRGLKNIFWTLAFPIIMATFFGFAFANLNQGAKLEAVPLGIVKSEEYSSNEILQKSIEEVSKNEEDALLKVTYFDTKEKAEAALKDKSIAGYLAVDTNINLHVSDSKIQQSILKEFIDHYLQMTSSTENIIAKDPMYGQNIQTILEENTTYLKEEETTTSTPNNVYIYYYALIAMTCLYGAFHGMKQVSMTQANQSPEACRINLSPVHKIKVFFISLCSVTLVQYLSILILIAYMHFIQHVEFGNRLGYILLASFAGCLVGVSFGAVVGAVSKKGEGLKTAIVIAFTMFMSFFAGLMQATIKYQVVKAAPIMAYINPAALISDSFYSLYYFDTLDRYIANVSLLFVFSIIQFFIVYLVMRRQQYESL